MEGKGIKSYQDLRIWQLGMEIAVRCYHLVKKFPPEERYGMTSQIQRSASRIPANIAEGWGRGRKNEFAHFLRIANGSLKEVETHLIMSVRVNLADDEEVQPILAWCEEEGKMLWSQIRSLTPD